MNTIGERIAQLRKEKGMTQEEFASILGVSAQSISKWENNLTMPDIMLLPLIADIFEVSIDILYAKKQPHKHALPFNDIPEATYDALLTTMQKSWDYGEQSSYSNMKTEKIAEETKEYLSEHPDSQTAIYSNTGGAVYANSEIGLILRKTTENMVDFLKDETAAEFLGVLCDSNFRKILSYQLSNNETSFTASSVAAKCSINVEEAEKVLESLMKYGLTICRNVDVGDEQIKIFGLYGGHKMLLIYAIMHLSKRLVEYQEHYRGFHGAPNEWFC